MMKDVASAINNTLESLVGPVPEREVRELRDLARNHNLDRVERGEAEIERVDGQLVARWGDYEMTRFREYDAK